MKKNRTVWIVVVVLIVIAIAVVTGNHYSTLKKQESDFSVRDTASVTKIFIADKQLNEVTLQRTKKGWILNGKYKANQKLIDMLLGTMKKMRVKAPVSLAEYNNVVERMAATAKKVEVYQEVYRIDLFNKIKLFKHEKLTKVFYVGGATANNLGTYMLIEGAETPYIVFIPSFRGFLYPRFSPEPDDWKSHTVFNKKLADIKSVEVVFHRDSMNSFRVDVVDALGNYKLTRLIDNREITRYDTLKLLNFLTSFRDLRYETRMNKIMNPVKMDSIIHSPPLYEITLVDRNKDTTYVRMFEKKKTEYNIPDLQIALVPVDHDRFFALINGGEDFVLMQYFVFDKVLKPLSYYENSGANR